MFKKIWNIVLFILPYKKLHSYYKGFAIKTRYNKYYFYYTDNKNIKYYCKCKNINSIKAAVDIVFKL